MMFIYLAPLVAIAGLIIFLATSKSAPPSDAKEIGKWMFIAGLLATLLVFARESFHLPP